jgi:hypothetical protein
MVSVAGRGNEALVAYNESPDHIATVRIGPDAKSLSTPVEIARMGSVLSSVSLAATQAGYAGVLTDAGSMVFFFDLDALGQSSGAVRMLHGVSAGSAPALVAADGCSAEVVFATFGTVGVIQVAADGTVRPFAEAGTVPGPGTPKIAIASAHDSVAVVWAAFTDTAGLVGYRAIGSDGQFLGNVVPLPAITMGSLLDTGATVSAVADGFLTAVITAHGSGPGSAIQIVHLSCPM